MRLLPCCLCVAWPSVRSAVLIPTLTGQLSSRYAIRPTLLPFAGSFAAPTRKKCSSKSNALVSTVWSSSGELDDGMQEYSLDGTKITTLVHFIWKQVVISGDTVIDATCGNGHDTVVLTKLTCGESNLGLVYGFDSQQIALENTSSLLERQLTANQRKRVHLFQMCHSKLAEVIKSDDSVSVVAFNLGYLPGGDKSLITESETTLKALNSAARLVRSGGIITVVSYVGHPGGREEYEAVRDFAANLPTSSWVCSHREWLNRPLCPRLLVLFKK